MQHVTFQTIKPSLHTTDCTIHRHDSIRRKRLLPYASCLRLDNGKKVESASSAGIHIHSNYTRRFLKKDAEGCIRQPTLARRNPTATPSHSWEPSSSSTSCSTETKQSGIALPLSAGTKGMAKSPAGSKPTLFYTWCEDEDNGAPSACVVVASALSTRTCRLHADRQVDTAVSTGLS